MGAPAPATIDIITSALKKLGVVGSAESAPAAEDTAFALTQFNEIVEQLNLRHRNCFFEREQAFTFTTTKDTYSIGASGADFTVADGDRPFRIEFAQIINPSASPKPVYIPCAVINVDQHQQISVPQLRALYPQLIYYKPTVPNGTIVPYPVPTLTSYQLNLIWWNQLDTVDVSTLATPLVLPQGFRRGLATKLAVACWLAFPKRTDLDELKRQDREVWADISSVTVAPPAISTTDGIQSGGSTFDWRSRSWQ